MAFEPFFFGRRLGEGLEVPARVQAEARPASRAQEGDLHLRPVGRAGAVPVVVHLAREEVREGVGAVVLEFFLRERRRARGARLHPVVARTLGVAVLDRLDLARIPDFHELVMENAPVPGPVAVVVGRALPGDHRRQVLGLERRDLPLVDGVVGDAVQAHLAVRPLLLPRPFDGDGEVLGLARGEDVQIAGRAAGAARVEPHAGVAPGHPDLGVHRLPGEPAVLRAFQDVGVHLHQRVPERLVVFLVLDALPVGAAGHHDGHLRLGVGPEYVDPQHHPVIHLDGQITFDNHTHLLSLRMRPCGARDGAARSIRVCS